MRAYQHQCTGSHQNFAVKRAWARVVLGRVTSWKSSCCTPLFGSCGVPFRLATCRHNGFGPPHRHRHRAIVDPVTRSQDTGRRNRAYGIFPHFLPRGRSHRYGTIGGNDRLFGRSRRKLWVETPGGGDVSRRGSVRTCFMRR